MGYWVYTIGMEILIPVIMIFFGILFRYKAPEKINWLYGYRTRRSMLNKDTWSYAHRYIGKLWLSMGACMLVITMIAVLLELRNSSDLSVLITVLQMIPLIGSLFVTESALKKTFDESGNRR